MECSHISQAMELKTWFEEWDNGKAGTVGWSVDMLLKTDPHPPRLFEELVYPCLGAVDI